MQTWGPPSDVPAFPADAAGGLPGYRGWRIYQRPFRYQSEQNRAPIPDGACASWATELLSRQHGRPFGGSKGPGEVPAAPSRRRRDDVEALDTGLSCQRSLRGRPGGDGFGRPGAGAPRPGHDRDPDQRSRLPQRGFAANQTAMRRLRRADLSPRGASAPHTRLRRVESWEAGLKPHAGWKRRPPSARLASRKGCPPPHCGDSGKLRPRHPNGHRRDADIWGGRSVARKLFWPGISGDFRSDHIGCGTRDLVYGAEGPECESSRNCPTYRTGDRRCRRCDLPRRTDDLASRTGNGGHPWRCCAGPAGKPCRRAHCSGVTCPGYAAQAGDR
jgi:hypothetical protein